MNIIDQIKECVIKGHINIESNYPPDLAGKPGVEELIAEEIGADGYAPDASRAVKEAKNLLNIT